MPRYEHILRIFLTALCTVVLECGAIKVMFHNAEQGIPVSHVVGRGPYHSEYVVTNVDIRTAKIYDLLEGQCFNAPTTFSAVTFFGLDFLPPGSVVIAYSGHEVLPELRRRFQAFTDPMRRVLPFTSLGCSGDPHSKVVRAGTNSLTLQGRRFTGASYIDAQHAALREIFWKNALGSAAVMIMIRFGFPMARAVRRLMGHNIGRLLMMQVCLRAILPRADPDDSASSGNSSSGGVAAGAEPDQCPAIDWNDPRFSPDRVHVFADELTWDNVTASRQGSNSSSAPGPFHLSYASADGMWNVSLI